MPAAMAWRVPLATLLFQVPVFVACWLEGCLWIERPGLGLLQDFGRITHITFVILFSFAVPKALRSFLSFFQPVLAEKPAAILFQRVDSRLLGMLRSRFERAIAVAAGAPTISPASEAGRPGFSLSCLRLTSQLVLCLFVVVFSTVVPLVVPTPIKSHVMSPVDFPLANLASNLWGFFGWGLLLSASIWVGVTIFWQTFSMLKLMAKENALNILPTHPDGAGGFGDLASMSFSVFWGIFSLSPFLLGWYFNPEIAPLQVRVGLLLYVIFLLGSFFFPLLPVNRIMRQARYAMCHRLTHEYNELLQRWQKQLDGEEDPDYGILTPLEAVEAQYERARSMPVWPFDSQSVTKIISLTLLPAGAFLLNLVSDTGSLFYRAVDYLAAEDQQEVTLVVHPPTPSEVSVDGLRFDLGDQVEDPGRGPLRPRTLTVPDMEEGYHYVQVTWGDGSSCSTLISVPMEGDALILTPDSGREPAKAAGSAPPRLGG